MADQRDSVRALAAVCEQVRACSRTTGKVQLVAQYLGRFVRPPNSSTATDDAEDADLVTAVGLLLGRPFPSTDPRVLRVGHRLIHDLAVHLLDVDGPMFSACARSAGESAEAFALLRAGQTGREADCSLSDVRTLFERLATTRRRERRLGLLADALRDADALVCKLVLKAISGWLRIGLSDLLAEQAIAQAFAASLAAVRGAMRRCNDLARVAIAARAGTLDAVQPVLFAPMAFMLAGSLAPGDALPAGTWVAEDKYDGIRVQVHHGRRWSAASEEPDHVGTQDLAFADRVGDPSDAGRDSTRLFSRGLEDVTASFPEIVSALAGWPHEAVIDGEALACRSDGSPLPFGRLQQRLGRKAPPAALRRATPVGLVVYDLLVLDGRVLLDEPLAERQQIIRELDWPPGVRVSVPQPIVVEPASPADSGDWPPAIASAYAAARRRGHEGLMLKRLDGRYEPGTRSATWLKVKRPAATLDVVVTAAEVGHGRRQSVLSDLTFAVLDDRVAAAPGSPSAWANIGKAYSGLTDREIERMTRRLNELTVRRLGRVRLVEPRIVLEVAFDGVQPSQRHKGGFALRFPRIVRWREDKPPHEVDTLTRVRELWERSLDGPDQAAE